MQFDIFPLFWVMGVYNVKYKKYHAMVRPFLETNNFVVLT